MAGFLDCIPTMGGACGRAAPSPGTAACGERPRDPDLNWRLFMLHYAVVFFIIALVAALFGFGGIAASAAGIAKILFVVFVVMAVGAFIVGLVRRN